MPLSRDLREFIECLNSNEVEYLVVGAGPAGPVFDDAWDDRAPGDLDGLSVSFIGRSSLLRNKDATGRAKDRIDAEELRKQKPST